MRPGHWALALVAGIGAGCTSPAKMGIAHAAPIHEFLQPIGTPDIPVTLHHSGSEHGINLEVDVPKDIPEEDVRYRATNPEGRSILFWRGRGRLDGHFVLPTLPKGFEKCQLELFVDGVNKGSYQATNLYTSKRTLPSPDGEEIKTGPGIKSFKAKWGVWKNALPYINLEIIVDPKYAGKDFQIGYRDLRTENYMIGAFGQSAEMKEGTYNFSSDSMTYPKEQVVEVDYEIFTAKSNGNGAPLERGVLRARIEGEYVNEAVH